jgi:hypothetical protein
MGAPSLAPRPQSTFKAGDGQPDYVLTLPVITGSGASYSFDANHTFTYATAGLYTVSFDFEAGVGETANVNFTAPPFLTISDVQNVGTVQVGTVPVPGPTVGAGAPGLVMAGAVLLAWCRRRRGLRGL